MRYAILDADDHRRNNVHQVKPDKEWQKSLELERGRVAVVSESVDADAYANKNSDDARRRKKREQVLVRIDTLTNSQKDE